MQPQREAPKKRIMIPAGYRAMIADYWRIKDPNYLILCQLMFSAMIRPKEAWRFRVADIDLTNGYISIAVDDSKLHYSRTAALVPRPRSGLSAMIQEVIYVKPWGRYRLPTRRVVLFLSRRFGT